MKNLLTRLSVVFLLLFTAQISTHARQDGDVEEELASVESTKDKTEEGEEKEGPNVEIQDTRILDYLYPVDYETAQNMGLQKLKEAIGDARMVMLGEQDKGDGATIENKIAIIKFMHEKMGFNVLAFESGFYSVNQVWDRVLEDEVPIDSARRNIYRDWRAAKEMQPLFTYLDQKLEEKNKLHLAGFDYKHLHMYDRKNYLQDLREGLESQKAVAENGSENWFFNLTADFLSNQFSHTVEKEDKEKYYEQLTKFRTRLDSADYTPERDFWAQELENLRTSVASVWDMSRTTEKDENQQNAQMAANLLWLSNHKYAGEKIIVWTGNIQVAKAYSGIKKTKYFNSDKLVSVGNNLNTLLGDELYVLGFTSYEGRFAKGEKREPYEMRLVSTCLEDKLSRANFPQSFMNFKDPELLAMDFFKKPYEMKGLVHTPQYGKWHEVYDGIFMVWSQTPATYEKGAE